MTSSNFNHNTAGYGGAICYGDGTLNGTLTDSTFTGNTATNDGGALLWGQGKVNLANSTFNDNKANRGGAIYFIIPGVMNNCNFANNKWINNNTKSNGIYAQTNLTINNGKGIVEIYTNHILSGISIVVLNNETYYYPPNTNINLHDKNYKKNLMKTIK